MTGRRSHGRLSALNGVVHQGSSAAARSADRCNRLLCDPQRFDTDHLVFDSLCRIPEVHGALGI